MKIKLTVLLLILAVLLSACDRAPAGNGEETAGNAEGDPSATGSAPYELKYVSNGDGTCYVSEILCNADYAGDVHLEIPAIAPNGERVVYVLAEKQTPLTPQWILKEDFDAHLAAPIEAKVKSGELDEFYYKKFCAYFSLMDATAEPNAQRAEQIIQRLPLAQYLPVYVLAPDLTSSEIYWLTDFIQTYTDYSHAQKWQDDLRFLKADQQYCGTNVALDVLAEQYGLHPNNTHRVTSLTVANGVLAIGNSFANFTELKSIQLPDSLRFIGARAFEGSACLRAIYRESKEPLVYIGNHLVAARDRVKGDATVREGTVCIAEAVFQGQTEMTSVTLPASLKGISSLAFPDCTGLTRVDYTGTVEDWVVLCAGESYSYVENGTKKTLQVTADPKTNPIYHAGHLFINGEEVTELVIPKQVTRLGFHTFENWKGLRQVVIPAHVEVVSSFTFYGTGEVKVLVEAKEKPAGWSFNWSEGAAEVVWGYSPEA